MDQHLKQQLTRWVSLWKEQTDFYHKAAQWAGLSDAAHWVLYRLCGAEDTLTQSMLCKENYFPKQTVNSAVAKLRADGLLTLTSQPGGNRKAIELTQSGEAFCEQYIAPLLRAEAASFEALTEEERELYLALTEKQLRLMEKGAEKLWL